MGSHPEIGNGDADEGHPHGPDVPRGMFFECRQDPERNGRQHGNQQRRDPEFNRRRQAFQQNLTDRSFGRQGGAQVEVKQVRQVASELHGQRPVQP